MVWPAQTPDINIIENIWYRIKRELKRHPERLTSATQLETAIQTIWEKVPVSYIQNLYCIHLQKTAKRDKVKGLTKY